MAHPCCICGSECYCLGSIDDAIVDKTPKGCEGCGCKEFAKDQGWEDDDDNDFYEDYADFDDEGLTATPPRKLPPQ